ncbi:MAG: SAM-dependent chlorinase/fluorinase [Proteobacteria bacterium]|nr:SAM-dependent chlorinase/fluorinase [Pseudomonadota bacterium]
MIVLFTDFGNDDPYVGQVHAVLARQAPATPIIDLLHSAPNYDIRSSAYLLAAYVPGLPVNSVVMAVVDPGVGGDRLPIVLQTNRRWYVGPDNGLFSVVAEREGVRSIGKLNVDDAVLPSFHGRDVFAPAASVLARGGSLNFTELTDLNRGGMEWPDDLFEVIYIDHYGNAITGINASSMPEDREYHVNGHIIKYARVFADARDGCAFWYYNSSNLIEIAINQGSAAEKLGLKIGSKIV